MEEVWKDITLSSSSFHAPLNPNLHAAAAAHQGLNLQDFLSPASATRDQPRTRVAGAGHLSSPATASSLILNWVSGDQPLTRSETASQLLCASTPSFLSSLNSPFEALVSTTSPSTASLLNSFPTKRSSEENECPGDRRHKRMMKNRESAARSRARRMAYTFELERERSQLTEENARLRRELQEQELFSAAAAIQKEAPKKRNLSRSFSALF